MVISNLKRFLRNLRVQRKLNLVTVATCGAVLLVASAALFTFQRYHFRRGLIRDLETTAEIIAANSLGALTFRDQQAALDALASLKAKPQITYACIHLSDGTEFAHRGPGDRRDEFHRRALRDGLRVEGYRLLLAQPILLEGDRLGTLYLDADTRAAHYELLRLYGGITGLVLSASILVGFLLSNKLQQVISGPILRLATTARSVAKEGDYSVRAEKLGEDEVGLLTDAFNQMLGQIEANATTLRNVNLELQSEIAERERTEAARRAADQRFRSLTESANDAIISIDERGRITSWNKGAHAIFGYEESEVLGEPILCLLPSPHHEHYLQSARRLSEGAGAEEADRSTEMRGLRKNGTELPVELSLYTWRAGGEQYFGAIFRDITERKQAAQEMEALNQQLRETSRQAGMAEVATGVLHNVGNVLNSVNVSATLVGERLRDSKISSLTRLAALLDQRRDDLGAFFTSDPRGAQVPSFVKSLAEHLASEQASQLQELDNLRKNIDHIKEIVAMQQAYAKVSGLVEPVAPASLVEDALSMNALALEGDQVKIVREFANVPPVAVDRHKVMQILINLIRNAKHAMRDGRTAGRQLTLRIGQVGADRVKIVVADNGVGIPRENLTLIFRHGFTTKKDGHGFGLHSGANAAKEMGGSLYVQSDGSGQGATFTLELPLSSTSAAAQAA